MRLNNFFFLFILLSLFLALSNIVQATTIQAEEITASGIPVTITGTCDSAKVWVSLEYGIGTPAKTIWVDQVTAGANKQYSASFTPSQNGNYIIYAACQDEATTTETFCVGTAGVDCVITPKAACGDGTCNDGETCSSCFQDCGNCQTPGSGTPGGKSCNPKWSCGTWNYCNASLEQSRNCNDLNKCEKNKLEVQACDECVESWVCSLWSDCKNDEQERTCVEEHYCGTDEQKPYLVKSCGVEIVAGPQPSQITNQLPPQQPVEAQTAHPATEPFSFKEFWDKYNLYILIGAIALVLILIITILFAYVFKPKKKAYNIDELRAWVQQEKAVGTSDENIKQILTQQTGWTEEEITQAFRGLPGGSLSSGP